MSHVASIEIQITDLKALAIVCDRLGLEFIAGQKTMRWYGRHVGDYPVPDGFEISDMGHCEHAIRVKGNPSAYEIGVCRRRDGKPGFTLLHDFYGGGFGLIAKAGENLCHVVQGYATEKAKAEARRLGFRVQEAKQSDGTIKLLLQR